jgi:hypothetical protein
MSAATPRPPVQELRALRQDLNGADDEKIRQIVALMDGSGNNQISQAVLDPLRPRLAALKPVRRLRFARILALPLDDLIVPAAAWRPGQAAIPRSVLKPMAAIVRSELGSDAEFIDRMIAGRNTDDHEVITRAGQALWPRAAQILGRSNQRSEWQETSLKPTVHGPLVNGIVTVLRRAALLKSLLRDVELGVLEPDEQALRGIVSNMATEPPEGCAMVFKLLIGHLPHAVSLLRPCVDLSATQAEKTLLQAAMDRGTGDILDDMEGRTDLAEGLSDGPLAAVGLEVQRIAGLLQDINHDPNAARHRPRVRGLREKLDTLCRGRFVDGMKAGLVGPLATATAPVGAADQKQLETCARDLRTVETVGRKLGNPGKYDALLSSASTAVEAAVSSGTLGAVRAVRLVEILAGPEAAEAMYNKAVASRVR